MAAGEVELDGEFKNGRGEFVDHETLNGRAIFVRFVISDITPTSCRFEQSFSDDGGKTWEVNWIAIDTRVKDEGNTPRGDAELTQSLKLGDHRKVLKAWKVAAAIANPI